ncbi:unnamed protein product, partial [Choristocarpus tenellus]
VVQPSDDVVARVVVDGIPYRESFASFALLTRRMTTGILERDLVLTLQAGQHEVIVQWRKWGTFVGVWRSSPSFLDGFAMSRFLSVMGERLGIVSQHILTPVVLMDNREEWQTVGGKILQFTLSSQSTVLITYGLPVTQYGHPSLDSWSWERWSSVAARLLVDGVPYRDSGTKKDGSERTV